MRCIQVTHLPGNSTHLITSMRTRINPPRAAGYSVDSYEEFACNLLTAAIGSKPGLQRAHWRTAAPGQPRPAGTSVPGGDQQPHDRTLVFGSPDAAVVTASGATGSVMESGLRRPHRQQWCLSALLATIAVTAGCLQDCSAQSSSTSQTNAALVLTSIGFAGAIADASVQEVTVRGDHSEARLLPPSLLP